MTNEEAQQMLAQLSEHFKQPVMPVGEYCKALRTWQDAHIARADRLRTALYPGFASEDAKTRDQAHEVYKAEKKTNRYEETARAGMQMGERDYAIEELKGIEDLIDSIGDVFLQITKSNLLARLIYGGQKLRTVQCPVHKGKWSGCVWEALPCGCLDGCNVTGWLPEKDDAAARRPAPGGPIPVTIYQDGSFELAPSMRPKP